jgi:hypothetical protein
MSKEELKPCPECHEKPAVVVGCRYGKVYFECECFNSSESADSLEEAIKNWNEECERNFIDPDQVCEYCGSDSCDCDLL